MHTRDLRSSPSNHLMRFARAEIIGAVETFAELLGHRKHANLLQKTLDEEGEADKRLTSIAESMVNEKAVREGVESGASRSRS